MFLIYHMGIFIVSAKESYCELSECTLIPFASLNHF